jgi:hypothetical protein
MRYLFYLNFNCSRPVERLQVLEVSADVFGVGLSVEAKR